MKKNQFLFVLIFLISISALPAIIGFAVSNRDYSYSGVVFNPVDGYTYLAKMLIGKSGDWLFTLPFTAWAGEGRLLYPFYIGLGHILQLTGISLSVGFNIIRLFSYGCLIFILSALVKHLSLDKKTNRGLILFLLAAGGGLGWILLPFGKFGADFWVSEAFPFLSSLANPHFPLALALMVLVIWMSIKSLSMATIIIYGLVGIGLSILSPFGFVLTAAILVLAWVWEALEKKPSLLLPILVFLFSGLPYSIYQYWAVTSTPQLAAWTAQNQTPTPAWWDIALSFSPWLILIIIGWRFVYARRHDPVIRRLILWVLMGVVLTIVPFNLQRRFLIGLSIPMTCLGIMVLPEVAESIKFSARKLRTICAFLAAPAPLLLVIMVSSAIVTRTPLYFYQSDELAAIQWLSQQGDGRSLVLASEQTSLMIPAASRLRVVYGHPFETMDAETNKTVTERYFNENPGKELEEKILVEINPDWIFYGPRERELGSPDILKDIAPTKQFGNVMLFSAAEILK